MDKNILLLTPISPVLAVQKPNTVPTASQKQMASIYRPAPIEFSFEGESFDVEKKPIYARKTLMLPAKYFLDLFEVKSSFDIKTNTFTIVDGECVTKIKVGDKVVSMNDVEFEMDEAPVILNGTLYVEAATIITAMYCDAYWQGDNILDIRNHTEPTDDSNNSEYIVDDPYNTDFYKDMPDY